MITNKNTLADATDIIQYIPQRHPMVMIDKLLSSTEESTITGLSIDAANIFCKDGLFTEPGLVENIAQTAASRVGYFCRSQNIPVPVGYIGAVKNLEIFFLPEVNTEIETQITIVHKVFDVTVIRGTVRAKGQIAATCEMKIFVSQHKIIGNTEIPK
jgi:3-hydroxyacyl-[acyl-carrier-protein] dehydratase